MEEVKLFQGDFTRLGKPWKRAIAYLGDVSIIIISCLIIYLGYSLIASGGRAICIASGFYKTLTFKVMIWLVFLSYFTYFIGKSGQSPGKKAMGLKVVNSAGEVIGYGKALMRSLFFLLYLWSGLALLISRVIAIADKKRRTMHDILCKTFVVGKGIEPEVEQIRQEGKQRISGPAIFGIAIPIIGPLLGFYVCGRVLYDIKQSNGLLRGKSLAIAGIVISSASLVGFIILSVFVILHSK